MKKIGIVLTMCMGLIMVACKDKNPATDPTENPATETTTTHEVDTAKVEVVSDQDNMVWVVYKDTTATVSLSQNILPNITVLQAGAHVSIVQSEEVAEEITYNLSGSSYDGGFYN